MNPNGKEIQFRYKNWRGETAIRRVTPISLRYGSTEFHPGPQWLMQAFDHGKAAERDFALGDCVFDFDLDASKIAEYEVGFVTHAHEKIERTLMALADEGKIAVHDGDEVVNRLFRALFIR